MRVITPNLVCKYSRRIATEASSPGGRKGIYMNVWRDSYDSFPEMNLLELVDQSPIGSLGLCCT